MIEGPMKASCPGCGQVRELSAAAGACVDCLRRGRADALIRALEAHQLSRHDFGLPPRPPRDPDGVRCPVCANECEIGPNERGFCGLRANVDGRLAALAGSPRRGLLQWYRDPLPTNCVADWVCPGRHQRGKHNLAVFYGACSFNCLFCQNWHFREMSPASRHILSADELSAAPDPDTFCVCYFGGDPTPQMPHALAASGRLAEKGMRICWETNGSMSRAYLRQAVDLSLGSGGCIKFDLKAWNENLHIALTGVSNGRTLQNFALAASRIPERPDPPPIIASTLLVPGYIDVAEVEAIARFIASFDKSIPYALLAFAPQFHMQDLPCTSREQADAALEAARAAGLTRVRLGNRHLLGMEKRQKKAVSG
jgi:pyruvate formate lyase activating enzyme